MEWIHGQRSGMHKGANAANNYARVLRVGGICLLI